MVYCVICDMQSVAFSHASDLINFLNDCYLFVIFSLNIMLSRHSREIMKMICLQPGCDRYYELFCRIWLFCFGLLFLTFIFDLFRSSKYGKFKRNPDEKILRKFFKAIHRNNTEQAVRLLVTYPQYVNTSIGKEKYTPFLMACYHGNTVLVKYMLKYEADVGLKTARGESPLFLGVFYLVNNLDSLDASCIRTLYYAGCNVNETNNYGFMALHLALHFDHKSLVRWLLRKGATIDIVQPGASARNHRPLDPTQMVESLLVF